VGKLVAQMVKLGPYTRFYEAHRSSFPNSGCSERKYAVLPPCVCTVRDRIISEKRGPRGAALPRQLELLASEYQNGGSPNPGTFKRFFYFVSREPAI
jgi:hypothetical protein